MSAPAYESYKDSFVEWLGQVPSHWDISKFRHCFDESSEKIDTKVVGPMLSVSGYRGIEIKEYDDENRRRRDDELVGYRIVRPGQLVVNTMWLNYAGLGVSSYEGHVSPAYRSYWIRTGLNGQYAHHLMRSSLYVKGYTRLLTGIRPNSLQMSRDDLMEFPVIVPPTAEQAAIAAFLDRETGKIDALIEAQTRLIELLKEKRQAVISHAVTKGLNPNAPMKDSGIEWLGQVPAHWEVVPVRRIAARVQTGTTPTTEAPSSDLADSCLNWFTPGDFGTSIKLQGSKKRVADSVVTAGEVRIYPAKSVLVIGIGATLGKVGIATNSCSSNQQINAITPNDKIISEYLGYSLIAQENVMRSLSNSSTIGIMNQDRTKDLFICLPPKMEQIDVIHHIEQATEAFETQMQLADKAAEILQERRAALISAAVTGKIDVRGLVNVKSEAA